MTLPQPNIPNADLDRSQDLIEKIQTVIGRASSTIKRDVSQFELGAPSETDATRLDALATSLFMTADQLIFLAEELGHVRDRRERQIGVRATGEAVKLVDKETIEGIEVELSIDEKALLTHMQEQETALGINDFMDLGFGLDMTSDLAARKDLFKKTMPSLIKRLSLTPIRVSSTGNTRARKYGLINASDAAIVETVTPTEAIDSEVIIEPEEVFDEPEPYQLPKIDVFASLRDPIEDERALFHAKVEKAVTEVLAETTQPRIHIQSIARRCAIPEAAFSRLSYVLGHDPRLGFVKKGEFTVKGRDLEEEWIDLEAIQSMVEATIAYMIRINKKTILFYDILKEALPNGKEPLVHEEQEKLRQMLSSDPRIKDLDSRSVITLK